VSERIQLTEVQAGGVQYTVLCAEEVLWERFVPFGHNRANRAGGAAFVEAAREQERLAAGSRACIYPLLRV